MLERFKGKKVIIFVAFSTGVGGATVPEKCKGTITDVDNEAIILDNKTYISRKYITKIES